MGERARLGVQPVEPAGEGADPQRSLAIDQQAGHRNVVQASRIVGVVLIASELAGDGIEPVQPAARGPHPHLAVVAGQDDGDVVDAQAAGVTQDR